MESLVWAYSVLVVLAVAVVALWVHARNTERRAAQAESELGRLRVLRDAVLTTAPTGAFLLRVDQRLAAPVSPATRRMLQHGCEADTFFANLLVSVAPEPLRQQAVGFLEALCRDSSDPNATPPANPIAELPCGDRVLHFRFHRIDLDLKTLGVLVTVEETKAEQRNSVPAAAPVAAVSAPSNAAKESAASEQLDWLTTILRRDADEVAKFLEEASERVAQVRAMLRMPSRAQSAFREKLQRIAELVAALRGDAEKIKLDSVAERARAFEHLLATLERKPELTGNDFLPMAPSLDDLFSHLAQLGDIAARLGGWRERTLAPTDAIERTVAIQTNATDVGSTMRALATELATPLGKAVSVVTVGLEDIPDAIRHTVAEVLRQLTHNAIAHGLETTERRTELGKAPAGTLVVQFTDTGTKGYELSFQDDGRGLDHERIRQVAIERGVLTAEIAERIDSRKLASLIFRPGFSTAMSGDEADNHGIGMDLVRERVHALGGKVGVATKPGEFTRFRIVLPYARSSQRVA
jgi:signal transduction histidine kinase